MKQSEAMRLANELDAYHTAPHHKQAAAELRRLSEALAAQPAPVQGDITEILDRLEVFVGGLGKAILRELRIALAAQPAPVQEPVATVIKKGADRQWMSERLGSLPDGIYSLYPTAPVQPAPVQPVPLTDEQIGNDPIFRAGVRFAEAAHGITKGQP